LKSKAAPFLFSCPQSWCLLRPIWWPLSSLAFRVFSVCAKNLPQKTKNWGRFKISAASEGHFFRPGTGPPTPVTAGPIPQETLLSGVSKLSHPERAPNRCPWRPAGNRAEIIVFGGPIFPKIVGELRFWPGLTAKTRVDCFLPRTCPPRLSPTGQNVPSSEKNLSLR